MGHPPHAYQWGPLLVDCHVEAEEMMDKNEMWIGKEDWPHKHLQRCNLILDYSQWFLTNDLKIGHQQFVHCIIHLQREWGLCHFPLLAISEGIHNLDL